jgi:hypothetical protein
LQKLRDRTIAPPQEIERLFCKRSFADNRRAGILGTPRLLVKNFDTKPKCRVLET